MAEKTIEFLDPPPEPTLTVTQTQLRALVQDAVRELLAAQAELKTVPPAPPPRVVDERYRPIPGITWVFNRSRRAVEVQWDMRTTEIPPLTVQPLTQAIARHALAVGAYRGIGTTRARSVIVLQDDPGWGEPLSAEEQAWADGTDPIKHSRIPLAKTLTGPGGQVLGPPELVEFEAEGAPAHGPPVDHMVSLVSVGARP